MCEPRSTGKTSCLFVNIFEKKQWGQVILRHTELTVYRCFLPDLAGFTGFYCTGPSPYSQTRLSSSVRTQDLCSLARIRYGKKMRAVHATCSMAERVGFEPTVPLPGRMLSKHVDSSTLAPLRVEKYKEEYLSMRVHDQQGEQVIQFCWSWAHLSR